MLAQLARALALTTSLALLCACSDNPPEPQVGEPSGPCNTVETNYGAPEMEDWAHVDQCSERAYAMSPPVFGAHYPIWAAYGVYDFPVPLGFLVHDLEHGAVVLLYNCPEGCADEVAEVEAFIDALPDDPRCTPPVRRQVVLSPDPTLGSRWAAAAWGYSLVADCFDPDLFGRFYTERRAHGREDTCADGQPFSEDPCP